MTMPSEALSAWCGGEILRPLAGGARSRLFLVRFAGRQGVLRAAPEGEPSLRWLDRVHGLAERAGIVVPRLVRAASGALAVTGWTLEDWCDGAPALPRDLDMLAPRVRHLHRLALGLPPRPGLAAVSERRDLPRPLMLRCARRPVRGPMTVVHGDLRPGNLLRLPGGRLALLDWEEARRDHAGYDEAALAGVATHPVRLAYEIAAGWRIEPAHARRCARRLQAQSGYNRPA